MSGSVEGFRESLAAEAPLSGLSAALEGLWWVGRGDWQRAHERVMAGEDPDSAWVHAHLHRIEGDLGNAAY